MSIRSPVRTVINVTRHPLGWAVEHDGQIYDASRDKEAANLARERHEFHLMRIEREKQDKADKLAQKEKAALAAKAAAAGTDAGAIDALRAQVREISRPDSEQLKE